MPVTTLGEAAAASLSDVTTKFFAAVPMNTLLTNWVNALIAVNLDDTINGRTVKNWIPIGQLLAVNVPVGVQGLFGANDAAIYVYRTCRAAQFALAGGRITSGQGAAILAAYIAVIS